MESITAAAARSDSGVTVCEINCRLVNVEPDKMAEACAPLYPEILLSSSGHTKFLAEYAPVVTIEHSDGTLGADSTGSPQPQRMPSSTAAPQPSHSPGIPALLRLKSWFPWMRSARDTAIDEQDTPPFAWHPRKQILAASGTADRVHLYNIEAVAPIFGSRQGSVPAPLQPELVLYHEFQQQVRSVAWRPPCGNALAVGCLHGICLWTFGGGPAGNASVSQRGHRSAWMTFLQTKAHCPVVSMSWSPCGKFLASASAYSSGVDIWKVAVGVACRIQTIIGDISILRWSPCGSYLLAGGTGDRFLVWETDKWNSQIWNCSDSGFLKEACWQSDGRAVALAFSNSTQIMMLHFISHSQRLNAQMLPLDLPELRATADPQDVTIHSMAWDAASDRMALVLKGSHPAAGLVALYSTRCDTLVRAHFIGYAKPMCVYSAHKHKRESADDNSCPRMSLQFQGSFKQGALLAIRHGEEHICMLPMYFVGV